MHEFKQLSRDLPEVKRGQLPAFASVVIFAVIGIVSFIIVFLIAEPALDALYDLSFWRMMLALLAVFVAVSVVLGGIFGAYLDRKKK